MGIIKKSSLLQSVSFILKDHQTLAGLVASLKEKQPRCKKRKKITK